MAVERTRYRFGPFRLDVDERLLLRSGQPVPLTPKAFDLLVYLVERAGRLVTKQELMSALWPSTFVEEGNLAYTVSALRKALSDGPDGPQIIQTVPTRGYRFAAVVTPDAPTPEAPTSTATPPAGARARWRTTAAITTGALAAIVGVAAIVPSVARRPTASPPARFTIPLPDTTRATYAVPVPQISPDGRRLAILVSAGVRVWLRNIDEQTARPLTGTEDARPLAGTDDARSVFWSPDGAHLAFTTSSALKTLRLSDGAIQVLCDSCEPAGGGTWSRAGRILFPTRRGGLLAVAAGGGPVVTITRPDQRAGEMAHRAPSFLPDGRHFLFVLRHASHAQSGLYVGRLDSPERRLLLAGEVPAILAPTGHLLLPQSGALVARAFDIDRLAFRGPAKPIVTAELLDNELGGQPAFSVSDTGVLAYAIVNKPRTQFQWFGRDGTPQQLVGEPGVYYTFDLSDDARRLVYGRVDPGNVHLWVLDMDRGIASRVTSGRSAYADPRWAAGSSIVATRWRPPPPAIVKIGPDGTESIVTATAVAHMVDDVGADGAQLLYRDPNGRLLALGLSGGAKPVAVRTAPSGRINQGRLSPDGRWVAYQETDEAGRVDVYVAPFPHGRWRWQVSAAGGVQPLWRQDSRELYYLGLDGTLYATPMRGDSSTPLLASKALFTTALSPPAPTIEEYGVDVAGQRFLLLRPVEDRVRSSVGVILNWPSLLSRDAHAGR